MQILHQSILYLERFLYGLPDLVPLDVLCPHVLDAEGGGEVGEAALVAEDVGDRHRGLPVAGKVGPVIGHLLHKKAFLKTHKVLQSKPIC